MTSSPSGELANFGLLKPRESNLRFFLKVNCFKKKGGREQEKNPANETGTKTSLQELDGKILVVLWAEGSCPQHVQGVDEDEGASEMLPAFGDGVLHLVQPSVQLLDHITVAVAHLAAPGEKEVVRWLPHGLQ